MSRRVGFFPLACVWVAALLAVESCRSGVAGSHTFTQTTEGIAEPPREGAPLSIPKSPGRPIVVMPLTRFRVSRSAASETPATLLRQASRESEISVRDATSAEALILAAPSDRGVMEATISWMPCDRDWLIRIDGGTDREDFSSALMRRLRRGLATLGVASSDGGVFGVWAAGMEHGQLTYHYLWPDVAWDDALVAACVERGWTRSQHDVLQEAYEFVLADAEQHEVGLASIELYGRIEFHLKGSACGAEQEFLQRFLHHWSLRPDTRPSCQSMTRGIQPQLR